MVNLVGADIFKVSIGLAIISTVMMMLVTKLRQLFTKNKLRAVLYALLILVTFALIGLLSSSKVLNDTPLSSFLAIEFFFLGLGILHLFALRKYFPDLSEDKSDFFLEFLFTLIYVCLGLIAFLQVVNRFRSPFNYMFTSAALLFVLPTMVYKMYEFAMIIPMPIFESWLFPLNKDIKDPTQKELTNPRIISFEFRKKEGDPEVTSFRVKAPKGMEFGKLFYFFITDYNERHPENKIEFLKHTKKKPYSWVFYFKPNRWSRIKHINFKKTIAENNIKENTVIVCRRVDIS
ncbi:TssN family type VI secretion system protein [Eudoraea adriatica]|uniref:TssN family type VI secretion system protein n=1 Tax=Eudoraea adriatica TaxID=446681 RepID=UPI00037D8D0D|nr:TssN family type VI secretion system protein [Eudoraea adriatica]